MGFFGWLIWSLGALFVTLVLEILLAVSLYIYLDIVHRDLFAQLVVWADGVLASLTELLRGYWPELATQASASLLGDFAPKAFLLLVIGLFASGVIRFFAWMVRHALRSDH